MATSFERIKNYHVSVHEEGGRVVFLRKLIAGGSEHSFGIHVARLAGVPVKVVRRAEEVLEELEEQVRAGTHKPAKVQRKTHQLSLFSPADPGVMELIELIEQIPLETTTPVEALFKLQELKRKVHSLVNN
jgi:DNA mismatch repair protein MutS